MTDRQPPNADYGAGDRVIYTSYHGETEAGVVSSVNERYVFVRFGNGRVQGCYSSMLTHDRPASPNDGKEP